MNNSEVTIVASTRFAGGAELYIARLAEVLKKSGLSVELWGSLPTWPLGIPRSNVAVGAKWGLRSLPRAILGISDARSDFRAAVSRMGSETLFNMHFKREQILFSKIASMRGPVVWTEHGKFPDGLFGWLIRPFYRSASGHVREVVCVSDLVAQSIRTKVKRGVRLSVINSAVDTEKFVPVDNVVRAESKANYGLSPIKPVAGFVGRMEKSKRPALAIEAGLQAGCQVLVAGTGSLLDSLKETYVSNREVIFVGHTTDPVTLYRAIDIHVFPSTGRGEGFPTVLLEAAASGVPTVASVDSGFGEYAEAAGGSSAPPVLGALAEAIRECLMDPVTARSKARDWGLSRSLKVWGDDYTEHFRLQETQ